MILEKQTEATILQEGESQESIGMSLDLDSAQVLMQMLSKNLYSDAIGSTIRECASNALDSHRRAGIDKPIIVSLNRNNHDNYEFSVEDFGIGLDADDVVNIISKYGKSTKRNSNTELGMMGLGFKAPLAYTSTFYFTARKNGMERKYMMYEGEEVNSIDLLHETPTDQPNGVKVTIPVNYYDRHDFVRKTKEQLAYFENVYFNVLDNEVSNDFTIHRSEHYQASSLSRDSYLHVCLDNVYYPLDFTKLGIDRISIPVGLRFSLSDGLFPTPNRESIRYTKEAKDIILAKISKMVDHFITKYNETVADSDDFMAVLRFHATNRRYVNVPGKNNSSFDLTDIVKHGTVLIASPKVSSLKKLDLQKLVRNKEYILGEYDKKFELYNGRMSQLKTYWRSGVDVINRNNEPHYFYSEKISGAMKDYIKSIAPKSTHAYFIRKVKTFKLGSLTKMNDYDTYMKLLDLPNYPRTEWRELITEFQAVLASLTKTFINLDEIVIPQAFLDSRKKQKGITVSVGGTKVRRIKLEGEVIGRYAVELERYVDGKNSKLVSKIYSLAEMHKYNKLVIYGSQADISTMDKLYASVNKNKVELAVFSERELKTLSTINVHNLIPLSKFMEGKNKPFKRIVTAYLIQKLHNNFSRSFIRKEKIGLISTDLYEKMQRLNDYKNEHYCGGNDTIYNSMLEVAQTHNLFDMEIYHEYVEVKNLLERLPFIEAMADKLQSYDNDNSPIISAFRDLFKYHGHRIDWKHYNIRINEEVVEELTENSVEELVENI
jgi:Histidine kinase-, DNA gyrase B-, and HSP90-like ATPase